MTKPTLTRHWWTCYAGEGKKRESPFLFTGAGGDRLSSTHFSDMFIRSCDQNDASPSFCCENDVLLSIRSKAPFSTFVGGGSW